MYEGCYQDDPNRDFSYLHGAYVYDVYECRTICRNRGDSFADLQVRTVLLCQYHSLYHQYTHALIPYVTMWIFRMAMNAGATIPTGPMELQRIVVISSVMG